MEPPPFAERLKAALGAGPVACLQIRLKDVDDDEVRKATEVILPVCHEYAVPVLMNDRPDLAFATGCDGVHIGQDDVPYSQARRILGPDAMIGVTCKKSRHLAIEAAEKGANYVAFGAFFPTETKAGTVRADPKIVAWWSEVSTTPSVAIGGITAENCGALVDSGVDFLAVIGGVWNHPDGEAASIRAFGKAMARA